MSIFVALFLFFLDFLCYGLLDQWLIHSLLVYFIASYLFNGTTKSTYAMFFLILAQDLFLYGRCGLGLLYLLPALFFMQLVRMVLDRKMLVFHVISLILVFCIEWLGVKKWLFCLNTSFNSTALKILLNVMVLLVLTFLGTRGNRWLPLLGDNQRKVWTPNR